MTHFPTVIRENIADLESERADLSTELDKLAADETRSADEITVRANEIATRAADIDVLLTSNRERLADLDKIEADRAATPKAPNFIRGGNPWGDMPTDRDTASEVRSRAIAGIERWDADDVLKESAVATVSHAGGGTDAGSASRDVRGVAAHVLRYSDPLYCSAFRKYATDPEGYLADFTRDEAHVWRAAREEQRAALGTTGAVLPSPLDPTIVLTNDGATDPMRALARVDTTVSNSKRYITSAGSTFSFDAEGAEVSDDTFTEAEVEIDVHRGTGFIQASMEAWMDQPNFDSEVAKIISDGKQRLEAGMFITGTGTNQPTGIETALATTASEIDSAGEALTASEVYGVLEDLPPRFRENAAWQLELSTRNVIHRLHSPSGSEPALIEGDNLLGLPFRLNSSVDPYSALDTSATASNRLLFVGDWDQYVILDRIGTQVYFLPPGVLQNSANNLPDGRVGWFAVWRVGAKPLTTSAFRMLDVETVA